jgi:DNA-binding LacI/PurR family transcriptional regulator
VRSKGITVVAIGQDLTGLGVPSIVHEERAAAQRAVRHLLARGHRRIAYVGRIRGSAVGTERFRGYRAALRHAGHFDGALVWDMAFRYAAGRDAVLRALDDGIAFTALQAGSDEIAMGAMAALHDRGLAVPQDVAVVGFGGVEMGAYLRPALTTLSTHPDLAAQHLRDLFRPDAPVGVPPALVLLERALVERESA